MLQYIFSTDNIAADDNDITQASGERKKDLTTISLGTLEKKGSFTGNICDVDLLNDGPLIEISNETDDNQSESMPPKSTTIWPEVTQSRLVELQCTTRKRVIQPNDNQTEPNDNQIIEQCDEKIRADRSFSSIIEWSKRKRIVANNQIEMDVDQ